MGVLLLRKSPWIDFCSIWIDWILYKVKYLASFMDIMLKPISDGYGFENETSTLAERPELLPYLFEGDMVLTDEQIGGIVAYVIL
ncbi:unnamed protein product [Toxocara canis]|uniref:Uncharacterized protein n=1 Tax=Toxocara canis TaxID=6265 RepID=A0A183TZT5_TOXCA|nr:unnamed protein product [Toxocara canis]